jgi:hypothetical protein
MGLGCKASTTVGTLQSGTYDGAYRSVGTARPSNRFKAYVGFLASHCTVLTCCGRSLVTLAARRSCILGSSTLLDIVSLSRSDSRDKERIVPLVEPSAVVGADQSYPRDHRCTTHNPPSPANLIYNTPSQLSCMWLLGHILGLY